MNRSIHQLLPSARMGDAITQYALELQKIIRLKGWDSRLFAPDGEIGKELLKTVQSQKTLPESLASTDLLIYHYSIASPATDVYRHALCRKMICYHNITPAVFFLPFSDSHAFLARQGREELKQLIPITDLATAVSHFNANELMDMGFKSVEVIPLIIPSDYRNTKPDSAILNEMNDGKKNILFVGRMAPNKRFEDLLQVFYYFHAGNSSSRLILAGPVEIEKYHVQVKDWIQKLELTEHVLITGRIILPKLIAHYQTAHAFLCLSEHEGFCLPLLEAMAYSIPVFALERAGVPETLEKTGVLIKKLDHALIAELLRTVLDQPELIREIVENQKKRLEKFNQTVLSARLSHCLNIVFGQPD